MASIADMLIQQGLQESGRPVDISGSIQKGAELAQAMQNMELKRAELEEKKANIKVVKAEKIMDAIEKGSNFKDKAAQNIYFKKHVPSMIKAFGMDDIFGSEVMEYVQTSPDVRNKLIGLRLDIQDKINNGELRGAEIIAYAQQKLSPEELPLLETDSLLEQQKFATKERNDTERSRMLMLGQEQRQQTQIQSVGKQQVAKDVAKEFADYQAAGGRATFEKNLKKLEEAAKKLESGQIQTGQLSAAIPFLGSDAAQDIINPATAALRDDVRGAVQGTLRMTLGSQFTEKEGEAIYNRAINPKQTGAENARRIRAEANAMRQTMANKEAEFAAQGYQVKAPKIKEQQPKPAAKAYQSEIQSAKAAINKLSKEKREAAIKRIAEGFGITVKDVKKELGD